MVRGGKKKKPVDDVEDGMSIHSDDLELGHASGESPAPEDQNMELVDDNCGDGDAVMSGNNEGDEECNELDGLDDNFLCENDNDKDSVNSFIKAAVQEIGACFEDENASRHHALFHGNDMSKSVSIRGGGPSNSRCACVLVVHR